MQTGLISSNPVVQIIHVNTYTIQIGPIICNPDTTHTGKRLSIPATVNSYSNAYKQVNKYLNIDAINTCYLIQMHSIHINAHTAIRNNPVVVISH